MSNSIPWLDHVFTIGDLACKGLLAARAAKREAHRAARAEPPVPPEWRVHPRPPPPTPDPPPAPPPSHAQPPEAQPSSPNPARTHQMFDLPPPPKFAPPRSPWERPARKTAPAPAPPSPAPESPPTTATPIPPQPRNDLHAPTPPPTEPAANASPASPSPAALAAFTQHLTSLLGDIVADVVRETLEVERDRQAAQLHALLVQQDARLEAILAEQARRHAAEMAALMERHDQTLHSIFHDQPHPTTPVVPDATLSEAAAEVQATPHLGPGDLRTGLVQHQHTMVRLDELDSHEQAAPPEGETPSPSTAPADFTPDDRRLPEPSLVAQVSALQHSTSTGRSTPLAIGSTKAMPHVTLKEGWGSPQHPWTPEGNHSPKTYLMSGTAALCETQSLCFSRFVQHPARWSPH